jgi:O-acetyl-ADP-ribose deacetylase (regulator of RNase III)
MKILKGNLIELALTGQFNIIIHGCNCFHTMGAGIAKQIKSTFPEAYQADLGTVKGSRTKLGDFSYCLVRRGDILLYVVNAYTQHRYGRDKQYVEYNAVASVFKSIAISFPPVENNRIAYPKIGASLGGGDWNIISKIIDDCLVNHDHTLVIL